MSLLFREKIDGQIAGQVMEPRLNDDKHPKGLGFKVTEFSPDVLRSRLAFSSAIAELMTEYKLVTFQLSAEQLSLLLNRRLAWCWGNTGTRPIDKMPHVDFLQPIGLLCHAEATSSGSQRYLGVTTFDRGYAAYIRTLEALLEEGKGLLCSKEQIQPVIDRLNDWEFSPEAYKDRENAVVGVDRLRNQMPSGAYGGSAFCTADFEARFVSRLHLELGVGTENPQALVHAHTKGSFAAVSADAFHFSAGGDLMSDTVRLVVLNEFGAQRHGST